MIERLDRIVLGLEALNAAAQVGAAAGPAWRGTSQVRQGSNGALHLLCTYRASRRPQRFG
jgi:hypothetical protein